MTCRITYDDDIAAQVVRFARTWLDAWNLCLKEIERDPWPREAGGLRIVELDDAPFGESPTIVLVSTWFPAAVKYFAREFGPDDEPEPGVEGAVHIYGIELFESGA